MSTSEPTKIIYFVRHGESIANISNVYQGPDSPLSERGKEQAELIAQRVSSLSFETLISSPFPRTKQTAEAIAKMTGKTPEYVDLFVERLKPTKMNGRPHGDPEIEELSKEWKKSLFDLELRAEDGENYSDLITRATNALKFLEERPEKNIVVVTHGFFLRTIIAKVLLGKTLTPESYKNFMRSSVTQNTGISILRNGGEYKDCPWQLYVYNDHAHLG